MRIDTTTAIAALTLLTFLNGTCSSEEVLLKSGQRLEGDILKETSQELYLDVGVDVIRIPIDRIEVRRASSEGLPATKALVNDNDIFQSAKLPVRSIRELAEKFGEGVVLVQTPGGLGSGFIINKKGYCVTNYHVVEKETRIAVNIFRKTDDDNFERRRINDVKILALNPFFDLALLQIPAQDDFDFRPVYIAEESPQHEGEEVFAIGNPLGLERSVSEGIVSTKNRTFAGIVYIQTTTQINPGNSGGPLFNRRGEVVGVTNMKMTGGEGLGFAIPVAYLKHFLRNRDAFAFDRSNPNTGYRYLDPPPRRQPETPPQP